MKNKYRILKIKNINNQKSSTKKNRIEKNIIIIKSQYNINVKNLLLFSIFISIITLHPIICKNIKGTDKRKLELGINEISLKINGIGDQEIIYADFNTMPDKIYCNGVEVDSSNIIGNKINIEDNESIITLEWNDNLNNCQSMFLDLINIIEIDLSNFDPSSVSTMREMFSGCTQLAKITIGNNFNSLTVNSVYKMFYNCALLKSIDLSNFDTSNIITMNNMFYGCSSLISLDLSNFNTNLVTKMDRMFKGCTSLVSLQLTNFNTKLVYDMIYMFDGCESLISLDVSMFDTSSVINMAYMFHKCKNLKNLYLNNFNTSLVTNMRYMFANCEKLLSLDLSNFDISKVENIEKFLLNCTSLTSVDISSFNTSLVINLEKMFYNCISLTSLNLSHFDTSSATDMTYMFANCSNLNYINLYSFKENEDLDTTNIFQYTPDDLIYCIEDETNIPNILSKLIEKECTVNDCETSWENNKKNRFENKKKKVEIFYDKCIYKSIEDVSKEFILTDKIPSTTIYSYEISSNMDELKDKYTNLTIIELSAEQIAYLKTLLNIDENEKIYCLVIDSLSNDSMTATSWYDYKLLFENGTELNLTSLNINMKVNISIPIRNLELANFDMAQLFSNEGYDIYDKNSDFYNDVCISVSIDNNDITINDRKSEIFPNNVTLCNENCEYKGVDIEDQRVICECDLINKKNNNTDEENTILNYFEADDGNFGTYLLDNVNFKPFTCGRLLFSFDNIKSNYAFYAIFFILVLNVFLIIKFFGFKIQNIRIYLFKESPVEQAVKQSFKKILTKRKSCINISRNISKEPKIVNRINTNMKRKSNKSIMTNRRKLSTIFYNKLEGKNTNNSKNISKSNLLGRKSTSNVYSKIIEVTHTIKKTDKNKEDNNKEDNKKEEEDKNEEDNNKDIDPNEMPFTQAVREDKRNILKVFKSILFTKIELINIFIGEEKIKELMLSEFILSLLISFFFNALLYSDEIVSHKYHNNGNLDFIVTFSISILSNIITSIVCYFLEYSPLIEERLEQIVEIKKEYDYLKTLTKFFKMLKIKIFIFFITEIIVIILCFYYIVIFCVIYSKSQLSLLINYLSSIIEELIKALIISSIIVITRKIGISCSNKYIYNTSKYINDKF